MLAGRWLGLILLLPSACVYGALADESVSVRLERISAGADTISFGLPLSPGVVSDLGQIQLSIEGQPVESSIKPLLYDHDPDGNPTTLRAVLVQFSRSLATGASLEVVVALDAAGPESTNVVVPFAQLSFTSAETARVVDRTIVNDGGTYRLQESNPRSVNLFVGREPSVIAHFEPGYLAHSGFLGPQVTAEEVAGDPNLKGLVFFSEALAPFVRSSYYEEPYDLHPDGVSVPNAVDNFEGWLYDRCATLLTAVSHVGDPKMLRHALRTCSYYSGQIVLDGPNRGIFAGKADPDSKYSHQRGLEAYYALTGDEGARRGPGDRGPLERRRAEYRSLPQGDPSRS